MKQARWNGSRFVLLVLTAFVATLLFPASANAVEGGAKPTIVLVHGAFADPSSWGDVVPRREKDGYETV